MSWETTFAIFSETHETWGASTDFLINTDPLGRNAVSEMKRTDTIKTPFARPKITPPIRSTQPKKAMFIKYLIITPNTLTTIRTPQNIIKKLNMLRYATSCTILESSLPRAL